MKKVKSVFWLLGLGILTLLLYACGSGGGSDSDSGTLQLSLTDAADHNFSEVVVSIKEVRAVPAGEEGAAEGGLPLIVSFDPPKVVNVLDLVFQQELLGEAVLPAGTYNQLRLVLERNTDPFSPANYITLATDPELKIPLTTPSRQESGLKVVGAFEIKAGEFTAVVLDFDPRRAIVEAGQSGQWLFKPTGIRVVQMEDFLPAYGAIIGTVAQEVTVDGLPTQSPVTEATVYAVPTEPEESAAIAAGAVNAEDGSFRLFLPEGDFELRVVADGFEPYSSLPDIFTVVVGEDTDAGDILLIPLPVD